MYKNKENYKYEINEIIEDFKRKLLILNKEFRIKKVNEKDREFRKQKYYNIKCLKCGWDENWVEEGFLNKYQCACCTGRTAVKGINTIGDIYPHLVKYFKNKENAFIYTPYSNKHIDLICPYCKSATTSQVNYISKNGFNCKICGDKISLPERVFGNLLRMNGIIFETQYSPKWANGKRYDFYIPSLNIIVETHGIQHYKQSSASSKFENTLQEQQENDLLKYNLAIQNGINPENYIVIDCRYSDFNYIINNIKESKIKYYLDMSAELIYNLFIQFNDNNCDEIWDMINNGNTIMQICNLKNLSFTFVYKYVKLGNSLNKCNYKLNRKSSKRISKYSLRGELIEKYDKITDAANIINPNNINSAITAISNCCNMRTKTAYGFIWKFSD